MRKRLEDLRLGECFVSPLTRNEGCVIDWGHTRTFRHTGGPRRKLHAVLVRVGGRDLLMSPDAIVEAEVGPYWAKRCRPDGRWKKYLGDKDESQEGTSRDEDEQAEEVTVGFAEGMRPALCDQG